jgi:hypothetical protein
VIKGMADFILYARKEEKEGIAENEDSEQTVYAYSESKNPNIEVKSRARFFPKKIEFTYENILKALDEAIKKQNQFFGTESTDTPDFQLYQETKVDIIPIQEEIKALANMLVQKGLTEDIKKIIESHLKGVKVTETTQGHAPALYAIRDELKELEKR